MQPTIRSDAVLHIGLRPEEAQHVDDLAQWCHKIFGHPSDSTFLQQSWILSTKLPDRLVKVFREAYLNPDTHLIHLRGLLVDDTELGGTPESWRTGDNTCSRIHSFTLVLFASLLGEVFAWATQQAGRLVTDIVPSMGMEHSLVSSSSSRELAWHTEDAFSEHRGDWVGLYGLRDRSEVATTISHVDQHRLPEAIFELLQQPRYVIEVDGAHDQRTMLTQHSVPIISMLGPQMVLRADRDYMSALPGDSEAADALLALTEHIDNNLSEVLIASGDIVFINNQRAVHGRRPFKARYQGNDRWLKRVNVARDLAARGMDGRTAGGRTIGRLPTMPEGTHN